SLSALADGIRDVGRAPIILLCVYVVTLFTALPFTALMRGSIASHLGNSLAADEAARGFNYRWLIEYQSQAGELGRTLRTTVIGFAAVLDNLSALIDNETRPASIVWIGAAYLLLWLYLTGGIIDRYARNRPTRSHEFFTACGVYFVRFLRLAPLIAAAYFVLFAYVHPFLFNGVYSTLTRDVTAERTAFFYRLALYALFGVMLIAVNVTFDYAKVRAVVEDRRSMIGAVLAGVRFIRRNLPTVVSLYVINGLMVLVVLFVYAVVAPGIGGTAPRLWLGFLVSQIYLLGRLWVRLVFFASETSLFQATLSYVGYVASPAAPIPEPPIVEKLAG
ncbi:MAG TPA: hypothetical protein VM692_05110, partial [Gammaproteobacteria bacterium]|nr:hypothetical protein [Gammaproteobacteria bacterium]